MQVAVVLLLLCIIAVAPSAFAPFAAALPATVASNLPEQVHVVFGGTRLLRPTSYVIQFVTLGNNAAASFVQFGLAPDPAALTTTVLGEDMPVLFTDADGASSEAAPCAQHERFLHSVVLNDLPQGTTVYYRAACHADGPWSDVFALKTVNHTAPRLVASVFGDMGSQMDVTSIPMLIQDTKAGAHDLVIHYGDIAYGPPNDCGASSDGFLNDIQPIAASVPYIFGVGNHESESEAANHTARYKYHNFLMRYGGQHALAAASGSSSIRYFSFNVQRVHFVLLDTDAWVLPEVWSLVKPQIQFLEKDLASVDRSETPWIVVMGHRAMYCTKAADAECNDEAEAIRYGFGNPQHGIERLLLQYGVDLYLSGHTHHYMRTHPVAQGKLIQRSYVNFRGKGVVHVQSGVGGVASPDPFTVPPREYDAFWDASYARGWARLTFWNDTHLEVEQYNAVDHSLVDSFTIVQNSYL
ncbi:iron/zinc purple acid phosphatase-like protein [Capsaspora owczarzaki ATCC 30864]|uniref:Purple acid phosphatase n=1 Tax=Capsaspora owczarzaki (strain ATCC 30864) TaxID=595528 RepID=A0A0D2USK7_CAPO3|nr:iron/zinc purple acid phosphatase-like protein [Capsaspora owczarzaki ATCC 30864]KJE97951.1 iron/zinc purple acid phosphatase-like protein [Capsaspora owczarzaki ATCC 30864]|eukprot:XP_004342617.1 iron/zinc purple acid phosphatase-like protein [Capsaspora owczarzaki ATCC 30864]